jgi:hypothetical protein
LDPNISTDIDLNTVLPYTLLFSPSIMPAKLAAIPELPSDEAFAVTSEFKADDSITKVSLGAGVYRDEHAQPWILPSVKAV